MTNLDKLLTSDKPKRKYFIPEVKLNIMLSKTKINGDCLEWQGTYFKNKKTRQKTYPYISYKGKIWRGNRLALFLNSGILPKEMYALHKCDNKKCINPEHLYWGTHLENMKDAVDRKLHAKMKKTHCPHGHKYSGDNLILYRNKRYCRSCRWYRFRKIKIQKKLKFSTNSEALQQAEKIAGEV